MEDTLSQENSSRSQRQEHKNLSVYTQKYWLQVLHYSAEEAKEREGRRGGGRGWRRKKEGKTETVRQTAIVEHSLETDTKAKINLTSDTLSDVKILAEAFEENP